MTSKVQTKTVRNAYNLLKEGQRNLSLESVKYPEKMDLRSKKHDASIALSKHRDFRFDKRQIAKIAAAREIYITKYLRSYSIALTE
jgi:hypothetical protein